MKTRVCYLLVVLSMLGLSNPAHAPAQMTLSTKAKPQYLGANGAIFFDGQVQHSELFAKVGRGFYFDVWHSISFERGSNFGKEVDFQIGKTGKIGPLNFDASAMYLLIQGGNVASMTQRISYDHPGESSVKLSPFVQVSEYWPTGGEGHGPASGVLTSFGAVLSAKLTDRLSLSKRSSLVLDNGAFGFNPAQLFRSYAQLNISLSENLTVAPGVLFSVPLSKTGDSRKREIVLELGLSRRF